MWYLYWIIDLHKDYHIKLCPLSSENGLLQRQLLRSLWNPLSTAKRIVHPPPTPNEPSYNTSFKSVPLVHVRASFGIPVPPQQPFPIHMPPRQPAVPPRQPVVPQDNLICPHNKPKPFPYSISNWNPGKPHLHKTGLKIPADERR